MNFKSGVPFIEKVYDYYRDYGYHAAKLDTASVASKNLRKSPTQYTKMILDTPYMCNKYHVVAYVDVKTMGDGVRTYGTFDEYWKHMDIPEELKSRSGLDKLLIPEQCELWVLNDPYARNYPSNLSVDDIELVGHNYEDIRDRASEYGRTAILTDRSGNLVLYGTARIEAAFVGSAVSEHPHVMLWDEFMQNREILNEAKGLDEPTSDDYVAYIHSLSGKAEKLGLSIVGNTSFTDAINSGREHDPEFLRKGMALETEDTPSF